ncbi:MAG: hypothetical protein KGJ79_13345 [Alphaproteobacteria bacterium]|nr:hypothetical protein [Alphaproteobacteria bacterium]MDE2112123.1 hypothetical protein [Alphaproteobacteria bacterium]MDE2493921.1 hypothetical protein [Alphaproteobacteria bacterium]
MAKSGKSAGRQERLAAALRENLKRRKTRDRALAAEPQHDPDEGASKLPVPDQNRALKSG